jgi:arylsulfatase A-like enzyme
METHRRRDVIKTAALAAAGLTIPQRAAGRSRDLPNFLWLVSEDNNPYIGAYGDQLAHTPNIDALAAKGVLYRNAFSTAPVCAPSRFAIVTGLYAETNAPANQMRARAAFPRFLSTYPELLRSAGYHCTNNGKTDYNADIPGARIWNENNTANAHWRSRPPGASFMAVFNYLTTHESQLFRPTPGRVTPDQVRVPAYLPDTPAVRGDYASYYNLIEKMDAQIGERLAQLAADGLAGDTIVFYYADNGGTLPGSKHYLHAQGLRVPLIVYVPPKWRKRLGITPGTVVEEPVSLIDLAPTLLSIIELKTPKTMQGQAFLGNAATPRRYVLGGRDRMDERYDTVRSVTDGRYSYVRNYMPHRPTGMHAAYAWNLKSFQDWEWLFLAEKLNTAQRRFFEPKPYEELYDLNADPDQIDNRIDDPAMRTRANELRRALDRHMIAINDNGLIPEGSPIEGYEASRRPGAYPLKRIMALAQAAARGDPRKLDMMRNALSDQNEVIRYWGATGLLILGKAAAPAAEQLADIAVEDPSPRVRVPAAEALVRLGREEAGVTALAKLAAPPEPAPVRLMAMNALDQNPMAARSVLGVIERAATSDEDASVKDAAVHLSSILRGIYDPGAPPPLINDPRNRKAAME